MNDGPTHRLFDSGKEGARVVIFGGVHGNEVCGPIAVRRVISRLEDGSLPLTAGSVILVPEANPRACAARQRLTEENLNRIFRKTEHPDSYEAQLANELCPLLEGADAFLDVHSAGAPGPANLFIDYPNEQNEAFAAIFPVEYAILGWPSVYDGNVHGFDSFTTSQYAHEVGAADVLIECGQHDDPKAPAVAEDAILRTLAHFGLTAPYGEAPQKAQRVHMKHIFAYDTDGDHLTKEWHHLESMLAGTIVAERANGEPIRVEKDSVMLFPKMTARPGDEWFYLGELED